MSICYVNRLDFYNSGDLWSSAAHYNHKAGVMVDIFSLNEDIISKLSMSFDTVIIGGGALLQNKRMSNSIAALKSFRKKILWGVGVDDIDGGEIAEGFDLVGIRDYNYTKNFDFVPCASVLHPIFRERKQPSKDFLIINHWKRRPIWTPFEDTTILVNRNTSISAIVDAIQDHEYVITSSYHAAYWGLLCNRKVIIVSTPFMPKLERFHVKIPMSLNFDESMLINAVNYPSYYDECLEKNSLFKEKIAKFLET